jgi:hypothetical protein
VAAGLEREIARASEPSAASDTGRIWAPGR